MAGSSHEAEFYVIFDAVMYGSKSKYVSRVRAVKTTKSKPTLTGGQVALKFSVNIPDNAFLRLIPDVVVNVPEGFWTSEPMQVTLLDPTEEG